MFLPPFSFNLEAFIKMPPISILSFMKMGGGGTGGELMMFSHGHVVIILSDLIKFKKLRILSLGQDILTTEKKIQNAEIFWQHLVDRRYS